MQSTRIALTVLLVGGLGLVAACAPPRPDEGYYSRGSKAAPDDDEEPQPTVAAPKDAGTTPPPTSDGGKINKAACNLTTAVPDKSGTVACKAGTGLAPNRTGGTPSDGTYVLTQCSFYDGAVEKPSARGTIRVTGEIVEYIDEGGYLGGAFKIEGSMLNIYGDLCTAPAAGATASPTLSFGFTFDGTDFVRIRDSVGQPVRVLRFTRQ